MLTQLWVRTKMRGVLNAGSAQGEVEVANEQPGTGKTIFASQLMRSVSRNRLTLYFGGGLRSILGVIGKGRKLGHQTTDSNIPHPALLTQKARKLASKSKKKARSEESAGDTLRHYASGLHR